MAQYKGTFEWRPLIRSSSRIRNLSFGTTVDYYERGNTGKVETRTEEVAVGIQLENGGSFVVSSEKTFDRLTRTLNIPSRNPQVGIAAGDYDFRAYTANFRTGPRYRIGGDASIT